MKTTTKKIVILSALLVGIFITLERKTIMDYAKQKIWDIVSEQRILTLHPSVRDKARAFINKAEEMGIQLRVTSAHRTYTQQDKLYAQGRTAPGKIITNAEAGESYHNFGLAIDVVPIINGIPQWNSPDWEIIGNLGKSFGFSWGGDWTSFKDKPHFQMSFGYSVAELHHKYINNIKVSNYVILTA